MSKEIADKLNELSPRELDVLVGKYFFGREVAVERVESKNNNNIKYLWVPKKKKKYTRYFSKSKTKTEKENTNFKPLPRWSTDIRDCWKLINESIERFGKISINLFDKDYSAVVLSGSEFSGKFMQSAVRAILLQTLVEMEKND